MALGSGCLAPSPVPSVCVESIHFRFEDQREFASAVAGYTNVGAEPHAIIVAVVSAHEFDVTPVLSPLPAHRSCGAALPVTDGTALLNQYTIMNPRCSPDEPCSDGVQEGRLFYRMELAAGATLAVRMLGRTARGAWRLTLLESCESTSHLATTTDSQPAEFIYVNPGPARSVVLRLSSPAEGSDAEVLDLSFTIR